MKKRQLPRSIKRLPKYGDGIDLLTKNKAGNMEFGSDIGGNAGVSAGLSTAGTLLSMMPDKTVRDSQGNLIGTRPSAGESIGSEALKYAGMGAAFGPYGAAAGALVGGTIGLINSNKQKQELDKARAEAEGRRMIDEEVMGAKYQDFLSSDYQTNTKSFYAFGGTINNLKRRLNKYPEGGEVEKYYPSGKIEGEKSKEEYINYLKSKPYFLTASQKWGAAKAQQMINKQIEDVKNTPIEYWKDMDMQTRIDYLQDPSLAGYHKIEDKIFNYESNPEYDIHELSHSTDTNIRNLPKDVFSTKNLYNDRTGSYQGKKYIFNQKYLDDDSIAEGIMNINPNYFEYNKFQQYGDDNLEYLSKPTEVRARVNTLRNNLIKNNINYHTLNQQQFEDYLNKNINNVDYNINSPVRIDNFETNQNPFEKKVIPYQQQNLEELKIGIGNKKSLLDVLKLYGSNNKPNTVLPIAAYGGYSDFANYPTTSLPLMVPPSQAKKRSISKFVNGGYGEPNSEIEDNELVQIPGEYPMAMDGGQLEMANSNMFEADGQTHEEMNSNGTTGIETYLPQGSRVFSDRVKHNGRTIASIVSPISKKIGKLEERMEKMPSKALENTINLLKNQEDFYFNKQEEIKQDKEAARTLRTFMKGGYKDC